MSTPHSYIYGNKEIDYWDPLAHPDKMKKRLDQFISHMALNCRPDFDLTEPKNLTLLVNTYYNRFKVSSEEFHFALLHGLEPGHQKAIAAKIGPHRTINDLIEFARPKKL